jgi:hypothetical protein
MLQALCKTESAISAAVCACVFIWRQAFYRWQSGCPFGGRVHQHDCPFSKTN